MHQRGMQVSLFASVNVRSCWDLVHSGCKCKITSCAGEKGARKLRHCTLSSIDGGNFCYSKWQRSIRISIHHSFHVWLREVMMSRSIQCFNLSKFLVPSILTDPRKWTYKMLENWNTIRGFYVHRHMIFLSTSQNHGFVTWRWIVTFPNKTRRGITKKQINSVLNFCNTVGRSWTKEKQHGGRCWQAV